ncbi:MAG: 2-succinyl-5-enolpyruvyl-6-hydroxy-3-cyclohexene-1-carboxylic-acid synthase [Anaerolineae bacterium]|nr:2-succinyl-5-enolpyruvyl-6-hydroxy-3-cyclohexene-1-carboxylic-acid synthase [Anaerolineae bacterium]
MTVFPNRNALWAHAFAEELIRSGVRHIVIAPGSRSTPLALAFAEQPEAQVFSLLDERGAGFFALGLARATGFPAAVLCSSGTAAANLFPAVVEANLSRVPLIALTADRSHEERSSGANQTIDQIKLFGDHVRWFFEVPLPEANPPDLALRGLRQLAARAVVSATGIPAGPVHLNFPFRKPLEPTPVRGDVPEPLPQALGYRGRADGLPLTTAQRGVIHPTETQVEALAQLIQAHPRGVILAGKQPLGAAAPAVLALAAQTGYPILADALSGLRFGTWIDQGYPVVCGSYDSTLPALPSELQPELILHVGGMPVSAAAERWLEQTSAARVMISADGVWEDAVHTAAHWLWADPGAVAEALAARVPQPVAPYEWGEAWAQLDALAARALSEVRVEAPDAEEWVLTEVLQVLPEDANLFVGNSLPIRHLDQLGLPMAKPVRAFANRGASGIDGVIATAAGVAAAAPDRPTVLVIGDVSFYHDLNSLLAVARAGLRNLHIVLINNGGGAIFHRLPIAAYEPPFRALFYTEHHLTFAPAAALFGLGYAAVARADEAAEALRAALRTQTPTVVEVSTDPDESARAQRLIQARIRDLLRPEGLHPRAADLRAVGIPNAR